MKTMSRNRFKTYKLRILSALVVAFIVTTFLFGCNIFNESDGAFIIVTSSLPTTGGTVVTTGSSTVELLALANQNWSFSHWSGDVESTENPLQITLTKNTLVNANFILASDETRINLRVTDGRFITDLKFGKVPGATDGFDSFIDLEAPPAPPDGVLFAWFQTEGKRLLHDYRNPYGAYREWSLIITPGASSSLEISWDIESNNSAGSWLLSNPDESIQADLISANSLSLQLEVPEIFTIVYNSLP
ncbi:MAG: hypothetical protein JJU13_18560 [Balneolaceae bacterium]|nr:hypothetical protein [Balneolaceae bacterium]